MHIACCQNSEIVLKVRIVVTSGWERGCRPREKKQRGFWNAGSFLHRMMYTQELCVFGQVCYAYASVKISGHCTKKSCLSNFDVFQIFFLNVRMFYPEKRSITFKASSETFLCQHSLPNLLCSFSLPCSSSVSLRISSWAILNLSAACSAFLSRQFCEVLSFSRSSLRD